MKKYIDAEELKDSFIFQADSAYSLWTLTGIVNDVDHMEAADVVERSKVRKVLLEEFGRDEEEAIDALMEKIDG